MGHDILQHLFSSLLQQGSSVLGGSLLTHRLALWQADSDRQDMGRGCVFTNLLWLVCSAGRAMISTLRC